MGATALNNPAHHTCPTCGHTWLHGQHGGHSCDTLMAVTIAEQAREIERLSSACAAHERHREAVIVSSANAALGVDGAAQVSAGEQTGVMFGFDDKSVMVSQEAYQIFMDRERAYREAHAPGECVAVPVELLERALRDCSFLPLESTAQCNIDRNAAVRDLRALLAQHGKAVGDE